MTDMDDKPAGLPEDAEIWRLFQHLRKEHRGVLRTFEQLRLVMEQLDEAKHDFGYAELAYAHVANYIGLAPDEIVAAADELDRRREEMWAEIKAAKLGVTTRDLETLVTMTNVKGQAA
jgi:hypothetical protein